MDNEFMILGCFDWEDRPNVEVISFADTLEEAKKDWDLLEKAIDSDNTEDNTVTLSDGTVANIFGLELTKIVKAEVVHR